MSFSPLPMPATQGLREICGSDRHDRRTRCRHVLVKRVRFPNLSIMFNYCSKDENGCQAACLRKYSMLPGRSRMRRNKMSIAGV